MADGGNEHRTSGGQPCRRVSFLLGLYALLSNLPRKEIRARFVLVTLSVIVMLGIAELAGVVGLLNYQTLSVPTGGSGSIVRGMSAIRSWDTGVSRIIVNEGSLCGEISAKHSAFRRMLRNRSTSGMTIEDFETTLIWIGPMS